MIIIKKAYLLSMADINYEYRDILIDRGKILKISKNINVDDYKDATIIKAVGRYVTPGLIDAHCHAGIYEEVYKEGVDVNETSSAVTPELRAIDAINHSDPAFKNALESGITTISVGPGSANPIGGTFAILKLKEGIVDDMAIVKESAMKMAVGENPKNVYKSKGIAPFTRMATASIIRENLKNASDYRRKYLDYLEKLANGMDVEFKYDPKMHSLMRVFDGMLVKIHAHRADDIVTAIRIMEEFNLKYTIEHATEGYMIADVLNKHKVSCIIGPTMYYKSKQETMNKSFEAARILSEHKVPFAVMTDHPIVELQNTLLQLGRFVRAGLSELDGLKSITITPAKFLGIDNKVGSIEVGKDADIVIWTHNPYHYLATPKCVIIDGKIMFKK